MLEAALRSPEPSLLQLSQPLFTHPPGDFKEFNILWVFWRSLTFIAVVIHKDNLLQEVSWRVINRTVH